MWPTRRTQRSPTGWGGAGIDGKRTQSDTANGKPRYGYSASGVAEVIEYSGTRWQLIQYTDGVLSDERYQAAAGDEATPDLATGWEPMVGGTEPAGTVTAGTRTLVSVADGETQALTVDGAKAIMVTRPHTVVNAAMDATATVTLNDPATATRPYWLTIVFKQHADGSKVLTLDGNVSSPGAVQPVLSTAGNAVDVLNFVWTGATWRLIGATFAQGAL